MLLSEVRNFLEKIRSQFDGMTLKLRGSLKEFSDIEEMRRQEESEREVSFFFVHIFYRFHLWHISCRKDC